MDSRNRIHFYLFNNYFLADFLVVVLTAVFDLAVILLLFRAFVF